MITTALLGLLAGIGIFLVACSMMSKNLETISSNGLKNLFAKAAKSRLVGVGIGAVGTAAIQSSGAITVMVIGFVNASIMSLEQAATIIYGANIGTTITGQIVALGFSGGGGISTTVLFSAFAGIGAFIILFGKSEKVKEVGGILAGFGMLFVGLSMMSSSMNSFAEAEAVENFLAMIRNPLLLVLIGTILTAIIQSSSVMTSVAITMVVAGLITLNQGIYLTMGSNIGSCVVALFAAIGASKNAKRTSLIHLFFNVGGVVFFMILSGILHVVSGGELSYGSIFADLFPHAPQLQLAMFHTVFNVITVLVFLPLTNGLIKVVRALIPEVEKVETEKKEELRLYYVDEHMLTTPFIAVQQTKNEIINMAEKSLQNFKLSLDIICNLNFDKKPEFEHREKELDFINKELVHFIVKLSKEQLSDQDHKYLSVAFHTISDLERVGDYAENIVEYADSLQSSGEGFSVSAIAEIQYMEEKVISLFDSCMAAYVNLDFDALHHAEQIEDEIDRITARMEDNHIKRMNEGICTPMVGAQYMSLASNAERIADHFMNVGKSIKEFA
ncbi:MAG: Na/Pi cotransporter family protein [Lachnospiraceae bacterium]|nr:Na/Pi cotransporter family protein [Lachnospiraceae bacterium]MBQ5375620.1 Na/Pi cotransporter family protein [Lachnospiraceae bacterium]MBR1849376.1 Na/Pi cotransporter family protein [Lachnospiraceae bacterium]